MEMTVWQELSRTLRGSRPYGELLRELGDIVRLPLPAAAWVGSLLAEDLERPLLMIVPREADALAALEASRLFLGDGDAVYFPAPSLTPYQATETSLLVRAQEAVALDRLLRGAVRCVVCTPRTLFRRLPTPDAYADAVLEVRADEEHPIDALTQHLVRFGYHRTDLVTEVGEFAIRGGVFDLFAPGHERPVRLDLFGDTVETIRGFDPQSQRSEERLEELRILPLLLFPGGVEEARRLGRLLSERSGADAAPETAGLGASEGSLLAALATGDDFPGWENYLPLLAPTTRMLPELLGDPLVFAVDPTALGEEVAHHEATLHNEYEAHHRGETVGWTAGEAEAEADAARFVATPEELEHPAEDVRACLDLAQTRLLSLALGTGGIDFEGTVTDLFHGQLPRFPNEVETARDRGDRVLLVAAPERRQPLVELLEGRGIDVTGRGVTLVEGDLQRGFRLPAAGVSLYTERQLFERMAPLRRRRKVRYGPFISSLRDLKVGDYIVHADHGIGQFVALRELRPEGADQAHLPPVLRDGGTTAATSVEVMEIVYAKGRTLLVPLSRLDEIQKFSGIEGASPRLDTLGGSSWNRTKSRVKRSLRDMAAELLELYAERQLSKAPPMPPDSDLLRQFETAFEFEETPDQLETIRGIKEDLERQRPMDRLLCGDVGYGKTEVAMRAAFKAVDSGYQVAVLAPTTILADQHLQTFRRRFADAPVTIDMISRFRSPAEVKQIANRLGEGKIDILIGTHRLLSRQLEFQKLGLLIVDEEQRFGVAQKERLKQLKKDIHVLAMSATPVPRTLQLSLAGVRDLSVIETPPKDRMAVETAILPSNEELIREAIEFEMERGGQVYFVYNRVETIERMLTYLKEVVPGARVTVGHGQMDEQELSRRMHAFTEGEFDVLLATTIIENGIDIPNVNTMIVHRADRFGLAQLYQLRGRVGRSDQLAYCYLLVPQDRVLSETARKRLSAIREFSDLGAGFRIAARDLEIRGAGNLLGAEQSGHIAAVGIETYLKMLEEAVRELRGETIEEGPSTAIDLPVAMSIPDDYIGDANLRMEIYRKIATAEEGREALLAELEDRFGAPPAPVHSLLSVASIKQLAEQLRIQSISAPKGKLVIRLRQDTRVHPEAVIQLVSKHPGASFSPTGVLTLNHAGGPGFLELVQEILAALTPEELPPAEDAGSEGEERAAAPLAFASAGRRP